MWTRTPLPHLTCDMQSCIVTFERSQPLFICSIQVLPMVADSPTYNETTSTYTLLCEVCLL